MALFSLLYDLFMKPLDMFQVGAWRGWVVSVEGKRVLEVGVGTGLNLPRYGPEKNLFVMDPSRDFISKAKKRVRTSKFKSSPKLLLGVGEALPFRDGVFDAVVFSWVLCTVSDPRRTLEEISRVLKQGGKVRLLEHVKLKGGSMAHFQDFLTPAWSRLAAGCHLNRDTVCLVKEAGFQAVQAKEKLRGLVVGIEALKPDQSP